MIWPIKLFAGVAGCWLLATAVYGVPDEAVSDDRNYRVIIDRNPFGLKPPPPPPTNAPAIDKAKDEILLTGISTIGGTRAYFMSKAPQGKNPEYYSLGVDDKKDGLEVLAIEAFAKPPSVKVRNAGVESVMTFASNGVKPPATPAPAGGAPGTPPAPGATLIPTAGGGPPARLPGASPANLPANTGGSGRVRQIPSRNPNPPTSPFNMGAAPMPSGANPMPSTPETDVLMMQLQRQANPNIAFPPIPMPPGAAIPPVPPR